MNDVYTLHYSLRLVRRTKITVACSLLRLMKNLKTRLLMMKSSQLVQETVNAEDHRQVLRSKIQITSVQLSPATWPGT